MSTRSALAAWWSKPYAPYVVALALQLALAPWFVHDWDGFVLLRSVEDFLAGVTPYETAEASPPHIFLDDHWPPVNTWYAYPPLELLLLTPFVGFAKLLSADPSLHRFALKVPMVLGNLALAHVGGRLAGAFAGPAARRRAEVLLLLNPFLVFIAAVWGMFDATMMALLMLSVLWIHERRHGAAGVAMGLALLVKVFPLFVSLLVALVVWRRDGLARAARLVAAAASTVAVVALPFLVRAPEGFLQQVFFMHWQRGAQGFALVSFPLQLQNLNNLFGWRIPIPPESVVLAASGTLLLVVVAFLHLLVPRVRDTQALLRATLVMFVAVLLVNKVVNEQYLVMPVALLSVLACVEAGPWEGARRAFTWGGLVSSVLIGLHFVTFVPADLARSWGWPRPDELVQSVANALDWPVLVVFSVPHAVAVLALVPALVAALRLVAPEFRECTDEARRALAGRLRAPAARPVASTLAVVALLALPPVASGILAYSPPEAPPPELAPHGLVLARYDLAIHNPSHDPLVRDGYWARGDYARPADGWYSATTAKVSKDLRALRDAGVDVVLVPYEAGNRLRLGTFFDAAADAGVRAAPVLDLGRLAHCPDAQRMPPSRLPASAELAATSVHEELAAACARGALVEPSSHPAVFRVEGRPALVVLNASLARGFSREWLPAPGAFVLAGIPPAAAPAAPDWADAAFVQPPLEESLAAFLDATASLAREARSPRVAAAFPTTRSVAEDAYDATWEEARRARADWVVVPWNLHREGSALEPVEGGPTDLLERTAAQARAFQTL